jgi:hypothetical protein
LLRKYESGKSVTRKFCSSSSNGSCANKHKIEFASSVEPRQNERIHKACRMKDQARNTHTCAKSYARYDDIMSSIGTES